MSEVFLKFDADSHTYTVNGEKLPSVTDICSMLTRYDINPDVLRQAARRGTMVHEYCELIDYGVETDGLPVEPELAGYVMAYMHFLRDYKPEWELIEQKMFSMSLGVAGTLDRFGTIDGHPTIVDLKTSPSADRRTKVAWACQLSGYEALLNREEDIRRWDVVLKKDGTYTIVDAGETEKRYGFSGKVLFSVLTSIQKILTGGTKK